MKPLPVAIFTHDRTVCACACVESLLRNLRCSGRGLRWILCDDRSKPGHVNAILKIFAQHGIKPSIHLNDDGRTGLGASMNKGLEDAFSTSFECLRIEDDWFLKRKLDIGQWASVMDKKSIGSIRLGMMFRRDHELRPFGDGLMKVVSDPDRKYTFNNQVAIVTDTVYDLCGGYPENVGPADVERALAESYNAITSNCRASPWTCWPEGWATRRYYDDTMPFDHVGKSTVGHGYVIPRKYDGLNDKSADEALRARFA